MNVDIANMVVNIGEQLQNVDWLDAGVTFVSVFLGALFAYKFGLKLELRKAKRVMRGDFCTISSQTFINLDTMLSYRKHVLDKIKNDYESKNIEAISTIIRGPMVSFDFDMDKYIFLNDCNRCFIPELKIVQSTYENLKFLWANYTQRIFAAKPEYLKGNKDVWDDMKKEFLVEYDVYTKLCIRLYYLNKHFNRCYERFFNVNYYDDLEEDFKSEEKLIKSIPNALTDEEFIKLDEYFENSWAPDHTLWEDIKYHYRKLKYRLKGLKIYFFGRSKPKIKRKSKGKK